jgi:hypothetical protein
MNFIVASILLELNTLLNIITEGVKIWLFTTAEGVID